MKKFLCLLSLMLSTSSLLSADAPYVNSAAIRDRFPSITKAEMENLREKRILFASRSFGLNLVNGLNTLKQENSMYDLTDAYQRFDVRRAGGDIAIIPANVFENANFVHFLATYWPHTKRLEEMDTLLRQPPHQFGQKVDIVIVYFHTALEEIFEDYAAQMDRWRVDFPDVTFIYVTAGFMSEEKAKDNEQAHRFSERVRQRYRGKVPLYDLGAILSDDFRAGNAYAPEYSSDPAGVHPNLPAGQNMMAKGFLLILTEALKNTSGTASTPTTTPTTRQAETLPQDHPEHKAVRALLDANGLTNMQVEAAARVENGHITGLYLQEGGITRLTHHIGTLKHLRTLHLYGDRALPHPLLAEISPAIGQCTKLEELLLNHNALISLPRELTRLGNLKTLSIADNHLQNLPAELVQWLEKHDPAGLAQQSPQS